MTGGAFNLAPLVDLRKGDVGGERGWEAAVAFREAEKSEAEEPIKKYRMKRQSATPMGRVTGLAFLRRTDPMGRAMGSFEDGSGILTH